MRPFGMTPEEAFAHYVVTDDQVSNLGIRQGIADFLGGFPPSELPPELTQRLIADQRKLVSRAEESLIPAEAIETARTLLRKWGAGP